MTVSHMTRGRAVALAMTIVTGLAPSAALGRGVFKCSYGDEKYKSKKAVVGCAYTRSLGFFTIAGSQGNARKQKFATASGMGPDPTAPGTLFPIVLSEAQAGFGSGPGGGTSNFPTWAGSLGSVVVTLTGYKKGKITGTVVGSLSGVLATTTTIEGNATFVGKCLVQ